MNERLAQPSLITAIALAAEGGLVALALLLASWWGHNPWGNLQWTSDMLLANLAAIVMGAVAALPIMAGLVYFDRHPSEWLLPLKQSVDREVVPLFAHCGIPEFALIALAAGFGEELFFRGLLQGGIAREITGVWGTVAGLVVGSATFGVCHWLNREYALIRLADRRLSGALADRHGQPARPHHRARAVRLLRALVSALLPAAGDPPVGPRRRRNLRRSLALCVLPSPRGRRCRRSRRMRV
jgi:hypothetical protein